MSDKALRAQLADFLDSHHAHVSFDQAVKGFPPKLRGRVPAGFEHSAWELVEHVRIAQADILEFCRKKTYREKKWPQDYWPARHAPKDAAAWNASIAACRRDRTAMQRLALDSSVDLLARVPNGTGQTYLREVLLVIDHAAYHVAQIVDLRRAMGAWPAARS
jgi:uncharacterized damage-inducible protein DinB